MAFTGSAVVKQISDRMWRITGLSLAGDASGSIGFSDRNIPADVPLPGGKEVAPYAHVTLQDAVKVTINPTTDVGVAVPVSVVKSGTDRDDFLITLHNDLAGGGQASGNLEIYVEFH